MTPIWIDSGTLTCAAGAGLAAARAAIASGRSGLCRGVRLDPQLDCALGAAPLERVQALPAGFERFASRNNRLAWLGLQQDGFLERCRAVIAAHGAARVGLVLGTSTSSMASTEEAYAALDPQGRFGAPYRHAELHNPHSTTDFVAALLALEGPAMTISTACSSSAKVFASAARWLDAGLVDAVIVGGVDSLCRSTLQGFHSLQLVSATLCRPFDAQRDGLCIGEAAAFAILTRERAPRARARLLGHGESCDAHHMSSPHPEGLGARLAIEAALRAAGLDARDVGYVNLHGTGTRTNDAVESRALAAALPQGVPASSTKGLTGHTLGAAGSVEALLAIDVFETGLLPGNLNLQTRGADIEYPILERNREARIDVVLSNSFGFGGNNCVLAFGRAG